MDFSNMSVFELSNYCVAYNIYLKNAKTDTEGILIGILDLSTSKNCVKVLVKGDNQYWSTEECVFQKSERRQWQRI